MVTIRTPNGFMQVEGEVVNDEVYGLGLPLVAQLKMLATWGPLLKHFQDVANAKTPKDKAIQFIETLAFASGNTVTRVDDEAVKHLEAILKSPEGSAFFDWILKTVKVSA